ncbi:MAG TPA: hypothetical protein VNU68_19480 [Verrucomicrobiae bacterium]|nr:hypothetical protein [Verrucomicrobiae bacterium]
MKGMLKTLRPKERQPSGPITLAPIALKAPASVDLPATPTPPANRSPEPKAEPAATSTATAANQSEPPKPPPGDGLAVLTLGQLGEILSARGDCLTIFGWEGTELPGQNISRFLKRGLDNDVGRFLEGRRTGKNTTDTILLRVTTLRRDGTEFSASVTTPTLSPNNKLEMPRFGWTVAFRASASTGEAELASAAKPSPSPAKSAVNEPATLPASGFNKAAQAPAQAATASDHAGKTSSEPPPSQSGAAPASPSAKVTEPTPALPAPRQDKSPSPDSSATSPGASLGTPGQDELANLRQNCAQLTEKLAIEQQAGTEARRRAEDLQERLARNAAESARVQSDLVNQNAERARSDSEWRQQLDTVANALTNKLQAAQTEAAQRNKGLDDELSSLRRERDELKRHLTAREADVAEAKTRREDLEKQLRKAARDLESAQADAAPPPQGGKPEFELRAQLDEAKEAVGYAEAGLKEELRRREKLEQQLHTLESLSQEHIEKTQRLTKELEELRQERNCLQNDLGAERQNAAQSKERVQALQTRLDQQTAELAKLQADFEQRTLARDRAEAAVREQLGKAEAQKKEMEAAWAEALACNHQFQKDIAGLREERDVHQGKLSAEQQSAGESKKQADELEARLRQSAADLERSQADLKRQQAERERAQAEWREQLEKAQAQANELRATCAEVTESKQHLQEDLTRLREHHDELNRKLAAEQRAAAESSRRAAELQTRLTQAAIQIEQAQAELENQQATRDRARADWQQQLTTAQERCDELTATQTAAKEQNTRLEEKLSALRQDHAELKGKLAAEQLAVVESKQRQHELEELLRNAANDLDHTQSEASRRSADLESEYQQERDELRAQLAATKSAANEAKRRADDLERRLQDATAELDQINEEFSKNQSELARTDSQWRSQLATAKAQVKELEGNWAGAMDRNMHSEEELARLRHAYDELQAQLAAEQLAAAEARQQADELIIRLEQNNTELADIEQLRIELDEQNAAREASTAEWRDQLDTVQNQKRDIEAAWANAMDRNMHAEEEINTLRQGYDELQAQLAAEQSTTAEARQQAEELLLRLEQTQTLSADLERALADLDEARINHEHSEIHWREQLEAAQAQKHELEAAWNENTDRSIRAEEELNDLRRAHDQLLARLTAEQQAASAARRQADELKTRAQRHTAELERAKADLEKQRADQKRAETEWNERLNSAKALTKKLEAAWATGVERNKRIEIELAALRQERDQLQTKLAGDRHTAHDPKKRLDQPATVSERPKTPTPRPLEPIPAPAEPRRHANMSSIPATIRRSQPPTPAISPAEETRGRTASSVDTELFGAPKGVERYNLKP